jgi:hypothetical protein
MNAAHMRISGDEDQQAENESLALRAEVLHAFQQLCVQLNGRSHRLLHSQESPPLQLGVLRYIASRIVGFPNAAPVIFNSGLLNI